MNFQVISVKTVETQFVDDKCNQRCAVPDCQSSVFARVNIRQIGNNINTGTDGFQPVCEYHYHKL